MSGRRPAAWPFPPPQAVIFDLDGTLTEPLLDFDAIRAEIGLAPKLPILEQLDAGDAALRARAEPIMRRHELEAIDRATLRDGCRELLELLGGRGVPVAILTRSVRAAVDRFVRRFDLRIASAWTREDGPPKPSPAGALALCRLLAVRPMHALVVGDYRFDVIAGRDAGCRTALLRDRETPEDLSTWGTPDLVIDSLRDLLALWAGE